MKLEHIGNEEQEDLEQMVTEALMRSKEAVPDVDAEWTRLAARMATASSQEEETGHLEDSSKAPRFSIRTIWMAIGSVAAVALVVFLFSLKRNELDSNALYEAKAQPTDIVILDAQHNERVVDGHDVKLSSASKMEMHAVVVPEGKDMRLTLSDGTQVWLNANSRLTYPTAFRGKNREVELQGEGYFKVTHDARHPFIVNVRGMQTRVLGTEFNVNATDADRPHVTLVKGRVEVMPMLDQDGTSSQGGKVIAPGEDAALGEHGEIKVSHVETDDVACWRDGIQLFNDASLRDILLQLGSWYNVNVVCHHEALLNKRLRYMYDRRKGIEEAVKMLNEISNNKIKLHNNTILIE